MMEDWEILKILDEVSTDEEGKVSTDEEEFKDDITDNMTTTLYTIPKTHRKRRITDKTSKLNFTDNGIHTASNMAKGEIVGPYRCIFPKIREDHLKGNCRLTTCTKGTFVETTEYVKPGKELKLKTESACFSDIPVPPVKPLKVTRCTSFMQMEAWLHKLNIKDPILLNSNKKAVANIITHSKKRRGLCAIEKSGLALANNFRDFHKGEKMYILMPSISVRAINQIEKLMCKDISFEVITWNTPTREINAVPSHWKVTTLTAQSESKEVAAALLDHDYVAGRSKIFF